MRGRGNGHGGSRGLVVAALVAACSSKSATTPPRSVEDAKPVITAPAPVSGAYRVDPKAPHGDVQVRVEWRDVPAEARASSGRTRCGTAKPGAVAPTVTWGIPDVLVAIEVDHGKEPAASPAHLVLEKCVLSPRIAIGSSVVVSSAMEGPQDLTIAALGSVRPLGPVTAPHSPRVVHLPVIGHEVDAGGTELVSVASAEDSAVVAVAPTPYYAVTEANGQVVLRDVPVGTWAVTALLPARSGQPARIAKGTVTVTADALAEVTLALTPP